MTVQYSATFHFTGRHEVSLLHRVLLYAVVVNLHKNGHLDIRDGVTLSVCVSETVPLGLCHNALDCIIRTCAYVGWIVHATHAPPGQTAVLCTYIHIILTVCVFFFYLDILFCSSLNYIETIGQKKECKNINGKQTALYKTLH